MNNLFGSVQTIVQGMSAKTKAAEAAEEYRVIGLIKSACEKRQKVLKNENLIPYFERYEKSPSDGVKITEVETNRVDNTLLEEFLQEHGKTLDDFKKKSSYIRISVVNPSKRERLNQYKWVESMLE